MKFIDFVGNEKIKQQLSYLHESGRLPHAIVIEGDTGLGKRTLARELALNLLCRGDDKPCRECPQCSKVLKGIHPDVYEYSASGGARSFHVDVVRDVKDDVFMSPNEADYKVYILGNCQGMSDSAQNAILKILEEPPEYALFILTTTTKSALLETVLSRSVVITLEGVDAKAGADYICSKNEEIDFDSALSAVSAWGGNIGKAIESLGDGKLSEITRCANEVCSALISQDEYELVEIFMKNFYRDNASLIMLLTFLKTVFRDAMLYTDGQDLMSGQGDSAKMLASRLNKERLLRLITTTDNIRLLAERNGNNAILITKICYDLRRAIGR